MPTSSSDSEGTSQRTPRRRSTTRSTTNPPATRTRKKATDDVAETLPSSVDDDSVPAFPKKKPLEKLNQLDAHVPHPSLLKI